MNKKLKQLASNKTSSNNEGKNIDLCYPRFVNNTKTFNKTQTTLPNKSLQYNLHYKTKNWITALELNELFYEVVFNGCLFIPYL
jgi:hypothetical protein